MIKGLLSHLPLHPPNEHPLKLGLIWLNHKEQVVINKEIADNYEDA